MVKVAIIGAGSIGSLLAGYLARGNWMVSVLAREAHANAIKERGLIVSHVSTGRSFTVNNIKVLEGMDDVRGQDLVVICVKAFDLEHVLNDLQEHAAIDEICQAIVLVQNGLGCEDLVEYTFPGIPILRLTTTNGALLDHPGRVFHTGAGETYIGPWKPNHDIPLLDSLANALGDGGLLATKVADIKERVWQKAIINCGINPVGAIFNIPNGRILEVPEVKAVSDILTREAVDVARATGHLLKFNGFKAVREVAEHTAVNRNSMLQDLDKGRNTEIDFITGVISRQGHQLGIPTPYSDMAVQIIHAMEALMRNNEQS